MWSTSVSCNVQSVTCGSRSLTTLRALATSCDTLAEYFRVSSSSMPIEITAWATAPAESLASWHTLGWPDGDALAVHEQHILHALVRLNTLERFFDFGRLDRQRNARSSSGHTRGTYSSVRPGGIQQPTRHTEHGTHHFCKTDQAQNASGGELCTTRICGTGAQNKPVQSQGSLAEANPPSGS